MTAHTKKMSQKKIASVIDANARTLEIAGADPEITKGLRLVAAYIRSKSGQRIFQGEAASLETASFSFSDDELRNASIEQIAELIERIDDRKHLEDIAVKRFSVPKGSLRNWSTKQDLKEKIRTMVRNESVHRTIGYVAKLKPEK